jgi:DNA invertase Pin-like site-specific DNA recombinase
MQQESVVIYSRSATDGYSVEYQNQQLIEYCASNNLEVRRCFKDIGSANKINQGLEMLIKYLTVEKDISKVLTTRLDRIARNNSLFRLTRSKLLELGVELICIQQPNYDQFLNFYFMEVKGERV